MADQFNLALGCIKAIKEFDGMDDSHLPEFIDQVEALQPLIDPCEEQYKVILFTYLKNKCVGKARHAIQNSENVNSWIILKNVLKTNFGEKQTTTELVDQLKTLRLNGTIENFYFKIMKIIKKINNRRLTHDENIFFSSEIQRIGLGVFKGHLPEPTRTLILARNPNDLNKAYEIIVEARHQFFTQHGPPSNHIFGTNRNQVNTNQNYNNNNNNRGNYNNNYNNNNYRNNNNNANRNNNTNRGNSTNYTNDRNNNQNYRNESNTNMSGNTRQTTNTTERTANRNNLYRNNNGYQRNSNQGSNTSYNNNNYNNSSNYNSNNYGNNGYNSNNHNRSYDSGNYRRPQQYNNSGNFRQNAQQGQQQQPSIEPMEIGQFESGFPLDRENNFLT